MRAIPRARVVELLSERPAQQLEDRVARALEAPDAEGECVARDELRFVAARLPPARVGALDAREVAGRGEGHAPRVEPEAQRLARRRRRCVAEGRQRAQGLAAQQEAVREAHPHAHRRGAAGGDAGRELLEQEILVLLRAAGLELEVEEVGVVGMQARGAPRELRRLEVAPRIAPGLDQMDGERRARRPAVGLGLREHLLQQLDAGVPPARREQRPAAALGGGAPRLVVADPALGSRQGGRPLPGLSRLAGLEHRDLVSHPACGDQAGAERRAERQEQQREPGQAARPHVSAPRLEVHPHEHPVAVLARLRAKALPRRGRGLRGVPHGCSPAARASRASASAKTGQLQHQAAPAFRPGERSADRGAVQRLAQARGIPAQHECAVGGDVAGRQVGQDPEVQQAGALCLAQREEAAVHGPGAAQVGDEAFDGGDGKARCAKPSASAARGMGSPSAGR